MQWFPQCGTDAPHPNLPAAASAPAPPPFSDINNAMEGAVESGGMLPGFPGGGGGAGFPRSGAGFPGGEAEFPGVGFPAAGFPGGGAGFPGGGAGFPGFR